MIKTTNFFFILLSSFVFHATGLINKYENVELQNLYLKRRSEFMYAAEGSEIIVDLAFSLKDSQKKPKGEVYLQATIFKFDDIASEVESLFSNDAETNPDLFACCSAEDVIISNSQGKGTCEEENTIASSLLQDDKYMYATRYVEDFVSDSQLNFVYNVTSTGNYMLLISYCNEVETSLEINGYVVWKNSYGYLPAFQYPLLKFYLKLSFVYIVTLLFWIYQLKTTKFENKNLTLYSFITVLILFSMFEINLRYFSLYGTNETGSPDGALNFFIYILLALKRALTRLLVIWIASGMTISLKKHGFIVKLTFFYFIITFVDLLMSNGGNEVIVLQFVIICLDAYYFMRTLNEINETIADNKPGVQVFKTLKVMIIIDLIMVCFFAVFSLAVKFEVHEYLRIGVERRWMLEAFWDVGYYLVLLAILILWRPSISADIKYGKVKLDETPEEEFGLMQS
eukprot:snap_masked-scaffold_1-processed-gene-10.21-mRNA-1 protein AED:1.00 eAED:1.00 QI:0/-1/0/0/-1/1/1/0/454